ncbi:hypothetical protein [Deinococcus apachensis]|uniref:hypothetical protein n=1 Tax=Deinococcus apachensis TaxID=309886 RepID=UPI0003A97296|nr:hypothetical protein [Deinococcus apachensis]
MRTLAWLPLVGALILSACATTDPPPSPYDASGAWTAEFKAATGEKAVLGASITMANKPHAGDFTMFLGGEVALFMYGNTLTGELHYYDAPHNIYRGKFENNSYLGTLKDDAGKLVYTLRLTRPE